MANPLFDALFAPLEGRASDLMILKDGTRLSGDAFFRLLARTAHALRAEGLRPGDRIAVQVAKSPEALAVYGAAVALGAVFLPLNTAYTPAEVDYFLGDATPRIFLCDSVQAPALTPVAERHGARLLTLDADGSGDLAQRMRDRPEEIGAEPRDAEDLAALLYTSGTTGRSKGAMLSQRNLLSNAEALADLWRFTERDVLIHALPIFHTHGLFVASNVTLLTGGAMVFLPGFDLEAILRWMPEATALMGVPTFYTRLLSDPRLTRALAAGMRLFVSGSAPLLADTHAEFEARTGHRILERYGMTETNMSTSNPYEGERRAGTVGFPLPGVELRILAQGREVAPGEIGVIEVRGPNVFQGYWQMPEKTAEELRPDGFFVTGDLGCRDAEGYVQIVGRQKDLIISGGYNIYPKEVELLLDEQPGVLESAVVGLPHPDLGEAALAVLVPRPGVTLDPQAVLGAIADRLARFKQPRAAVLVEELPRNTMGKVQKTLLRARYAGLFADGRGS
ncbi:malonyl-CoA synthase [Cereibacter sphaeroides]|uniref:malonate--CoA ligase n=1 Tax=Cereibacter sphaeroides TaxID=1063 RepID=UPI000F51F620|nr:malonyl-CoA synthase [Cereibacter sphaeroides]AZB54129.1 malonyl-CoA synthase [Cereibacter sphaeroides]AZB58389.1 malonyl-CoA synthase [Cereibacter sphaeroides]